MIGRVTGSYEFVWLQDVDSCHFRIKNVIADICYQLGIVVLAVRPNITGGIVLKTKLKTFLIVY